MSDRLIEPGARFGDPSVGAGPVRPRRPGGVDWTSSDSRDALHLIAEGVTEVAGFGVAAISVARDDGYMQVMAVAGSDDARRTLEGARTPIAELMEEVAKADDWGLLKFVPHERLDLDEGSWGWVPDYEPLDVPDAWHPLDLLVAPLRDADGVLRGSLSIDLPRDGRRPDAAQRRLLELYAAQAGRAVVTALEREALAEQVRLAEAARTIVRRASAKLSLEQVLAESREALVEGFRAAGLWIQTLHEGGQGAIHTASSARISPSRDLMALGDRVARQTWEAQATLSVDVHADEAAPLLTSEDWALLRQLLESLGAGSLLATPLGAGPACLGLLVLTRRPHAPEWSDVEKGAALDIGHDLGHAILNARLFEREHRARVELQALDTYKSQLIATVSHELKNPLAAILGHLEMLEGVENLDRRTLTSLAAIDRGAHRLARVVDDLLLLSKVGDPDNPVIATPVDLRRTIEDVLDLVGVQAQRKRITVRLETDGDDLHAAGDPGELDRVCANLLSNAVKYTPEGRGVLVRLARQDDLVVLTCTDEGIGISAEDQKGLFTEFFRSSNPEAVAQPGTGLGLAIVSRIVSRHGGRIEVESALGAGSTFRVFLPAAA
ncbi:sensor histidine kinase [Nocardioides ferulae]|uniref:sensor histidine kinase n=1 Tax=Nocardioides ferulae TaxID=2340821 RepID=UPI000EAF3AE0|nr:GAF domain-containing sensor histidine kinase [Nocardioides ferulae]